MKHSAPISLDVLFLLLLVPAHMEIKGLSFLLVVPLFFYIVLEIWHPLTQYAVLPNQLGKARLAFLARLFLLFIIISGAVLVPSLRNIYSRLVLETGANTSDYLETYAQIHDGAIQVEAALNYLSEGKNPYVERYDDTPLKYYGSSGIELPTNPAFEHFVYLPGLVVFSFPVYQLFGMFDILYDQRWVYLFAYVILVLFLPQLVNASTHKLALLAGVALNPLLTGPVIIGMNDVIVVLPLVFSVFALSRKRFLLSAIIFGIACTLKQSAWFFAPFYILTFFHALPPSRRNWQMVKYLSVIGVLAVIIIAPFALWSLSDFITDVFAYPGGSVDVNYPIRGYTVGVLLVGAGVIQSPLDYFPFWIFQLVVGVPLMVQLLKYQARQNGPGWLFVTAGLFVFGIGLVSRFFQDNYVGFVAIFISLGFLMNLASGDTNIESAPPDSISRAK